MKGGLGLVVFWGVGILQGRYFFLFRETKKWFWGSAGQQKKGKKGFYEVRTKGNAFLVCFGNRKGKDFPDAMSEGGGGKQELGAQFVFLRWG